MDLATEMADDKKAIERAIERAEKLLRLAAPSSNTTEAERSSAALTAAEIISEYDLIISERPPKKRARKAEPKHEPQPQPHYGYESYWDPWDTNQDPSPYVGPWYTCNSNYAAAVCESCHGTVSKGEGVWMRLKGGHLEYRHAWHPSPI